MFHIIPYHRAMPSPFPGMDPFLEQRWGDFHARLATYLSDAINPGLPRSLVARVEDRILVEADGGEEPSYSTQYKPDAYVSETYDADGDDEGGGTATLAGPVTRPYVFPKRAGDPPTQRSVLITEAGGGRVVSAIEILSPTNKRRGAGLDDYRRKQRDYDEAGVNLLELDLLLGGARATHAARAGIPANLRAAHHASLTNHARRGRLEYYPMPIRQPLPRIALPLRTPQEAVALDLQGVFETTYARGYYDRSIRYADDADEVLATLPEQEHAWLRELLPAGHRA